MIPRKKFSKREKIILMGVVVVLMALTADFSIRIWQRSMTATQNKERELQQQWDYTQAMLKRSNLIEMNYKEVYVRYPKLFGSNDVTRVMADLDAAAKVAGIQVDMLRPVQTEQTTRYELSLRGSWVKIMKFLQTAEGTSYLFIFPSFTVTPQEPSGDLVVLAQVERVNL